MGFEVINLKTIVKCIFDWRMKRGFMINSKTMNVELLVKRIFWFDNEKGVLWHTVVCARSKLFCRLMPTLTQIGKGPILLRMVLIALKQNNQAAYIISHIFRVLTGVKAPLKPWWGLMGCMCCLPLWLNQNEHMDKFFMIDKGYATIDAIFFVKKGLVIDVATCESHGDF